MKKIFFVVFFISTLSVFCQKKLESQVNALIKSDFFHTYNVEKFFLHTNKSIYFAGESIWFKSYVVDSDNNLPLSETTNLYVNLYAPDLSLISSNLFYVENGLTHGDFELSKTLQSGTYYLQLDTQKNRNFNQGSIYPIKIENLNTNIKSYPSSKSLEVNKNVLNHNKVEPNIQFYPESNTFLKGIQNMVVFSAEKNIKGIIVDNESNKTVASIQSNDFGVGAFKVPGDSDYTAIITNNDKNIRIDLPKASEKGFIIHKISNNYEDDIIHFELKTNEATIKDYDASHVFAVLHRNGSIKSVAPIEIKKTIKDYRISVFKQNLFNGVNTLTLFNENNHVIAERNFYWKTNHIADVEVTKGQQNGDSLDINLRLLNKATEMNLSISVLPKNTKVYHDQSSILSAFLLSPFIHKDFKISNPNTISNAQLDFIIQSLNINSFPYKDIGTLSYNDEHGVTIKGSVNASLKSSKEYKVMLTSKENNLLLVRPLNDDKTFLFDKLLLRHPTKYQLSLLDNKGEIVKAKFFVFNSFTDYRALAKLQIDALDNIIENTNDDSKIVDLDFDLSLPEFDDVEKLDEVVIRADKIRESQETQSKLTKSGIQGVSFSRIFKPSDSPYAKGDILQYFRTIPGITVKYSQDNTPYLNNERYLKTLNNTGDAPFTIIMDGAPLGTDVSIINYRQASEFEFIIVNYRGAGYGPLYPKGVINLVTVKGSDGKPISKANPDIQILDSKFGFNMPSSTRFEAPIFQFPSYSSKENYRALDWVPNFTLKPNIYNTLKVNVEDSNGVKLIINGLNPDGNIIYKVIDLD